MYVGVNFTIQPNFVTGLYFLIILLFKFKINITCKQYIKLSKQRQTLLQIRFHSTIHRYFSQILGFGNNLLIRLRLIPITQRSIRLRLIPITQSTDPFHSCDRGCHSKMVIVFSQLSDPILYNSSPLKQLTVQVPKAVISLMNPVSAG